MQLRADVLAVKFEADEAAVLELLKKYTNSELSLGQEVIVPPDQQAEILFTISSSTAKCRGCSRSYLVTQDSCQCGRSLGRCPSCHLYTSFSLTKFRIFERNEYSCDSCGSYCSACNYRNRKHCYFWAGKSGSKWLHGCPNCPTPLPEGTEGNISEYFKPFWNAIGPVLGEIAVELIRPKNKSDGNS